MPNDSLSATTSSGSQTVTQDPQTASQPPATAGSANQSNVQPGTATALLNSGQGQTLHNTPLSTVNLNSVAATTPATSADLTIPSKHHINPVLLGFSGLLLVVAVVLVWTTSRSVKSTT